MLEGIALPLLGGFLIALGILNIRGNLSSIHWYQRQRITQETARPYGKWMGSGSVVVGGGLFFGGVLAWTPWSPACPYVAVTAIAVGLGLMAYAQFKYNKGLF